MKIEGRENLPIGQVQGCDVVASYMDDGLLYSAAMTWQGHAIETDGRSYINLFGMESGGGCVGDIGINQWRIIRDLVQCDVIEELTELALAHQWIAPKPGYVPEDEDVVPALPARALPAPPVRDQEATPIVRVSREVCDDRVDTGRFATEIATDFRITVGDEDVLLYFPDVVKGYNVPLLFAFGEAGWPLDRVDRVLPLIQMVMRDPRVIEARKQLAAGLPPHHSGAA
jgi:hypothetical protein